MIEALIAARVAWTLAALIGVALGVRLLTVSSKDLSARRALGQNGMLEITGRMMRRTALIKLVCFLLFLLGGLAGLFRPAHASFWAAAISWMLVVIEGGLASGLYLNLRDRDRIRQHYSKGETS